MSKRSLVALTLVLVTFPAWAGSELTSEPITNELSNQRAAETDESGSTATGHGGTGNGSDIGWNGWGLRVGVTDDPDQVIGGAHFNLGEFVPHLRFQPDVQLGVGDDHTTLYATAPVYYRFDTDTRFTPYAGGGVSLGFVDRDLPSGSNADDTEFEAGFKVTGGLEWPRGQGQAFFVELSIGFGDVHDLAVLAAWSF